MSHHSNALTNEPVVSVAMVVCNASRFLSEAIESILGQTFGEFEFIVVDFGSTDDSRAIISLYAAQDSRVKFHVIPHCGLAEARNVSCSLAQGQYVAIMDADDVSKPERLSLQVEFMAKHPDVSVLGGAVEWIDSMGRPLVRWGNPRNDREIQSALLECCPLWQPTVMMRRQAFAQVGGYRPPFAPAEDYDLWLRMAEHFQFANLTQVLLKYRIHPNQASVRRLTKQTLGCLAAKLSASERRSGNLDPLNSAVEITSELLTRLGVTSEAQQIALANAYLQWISNLYRAGEYSAALSAALEMLRSSEWKHARKAATDVRLVTARIYWKQKKMLQGAIVAGRIIRERPTVLGRPLRPLLRWVGLA